MLQRPPAAAAARRAAAAPRTVPGTVVKSTPFTAAHRQRRSSLDASPWSPGQQQAGRGQEQAAEEEEDDEEEEEEELPGTVVKPAPVPRHLHLPEEKEVQEEGEEEEQEEAVPGRAGASRRARRALLADTAPQHLAAQGDPSHAEPLPQGQGAESPGNEAPSKGRRRSRARSRSLPEAMDDRPQQEEAAAQRPSRTRARRVDSAVREPRMDQAGEGEVIPGRERRRGRSSGLAEESLPSDAPDTRQGQGRGRKRQEPGEATADPHPTAKNRGKRSGALEGRTEQEGTCSPPTTRSKKRKVEDTEAEAPAGASKKRGKAAATREEEEKPGAAPTPVSSRLRRRAGATPEQAQQSPSGRGGSKRTRSMR